MVVVNSLEEIQCVLFVRFEDTSEQISDFQFKIIFSGVFDFHVELQGFLVSIFGVIVVHDCSSSFIRFSQFIFTIIQEILEFLLTE